MRKLLNAHYINIIWRRLQELEVIDRSIYLALFLFILQHKNSCKRCGSGMKLFMISSQLLILGTHSLLKNEKVRKTNTAGR